MSLKSWTRLDILHPGPMPNSARFQHRACLTHLSPPGFLSRALAEAEAKVVLAAGDSGGDRELEQMVRLRLLHGVLCTCETRQQLSALPCPIRWMSWMRFRGAQICSALQSGFNTGAGLYSALGYRWSVPLHLQRVLQDWNLNWCMYKISVLFTIELQRDT